MRLRNLLTLVVHLIVASSASGIAETGAEAWLRYAPLSAAQAAHYAGLPEAILVMDHSLVTESAVAELQHGMKSMLGTQLKVELTPSADQDAIVLGTYDELKQYSPEFANEQAIPDSYRMMRREFHGHNFVIIAGADERGILYGAFAFLRRIAVLEDVSNLDESQAPNNNIRWVDEWDNPDGSIERGYAGRSIFFDAQHVRLDLTRVGAYARLLASVGINGCNVNNVNAAPTVLSDDSLRELVRIANAMRTWGVRMALSVNLASPQTVDHLDTFDPLDPAVQQWWQQKIDSIYHLIPDFAGFTVKADSEGQSGPAQYGRTPSDAANMLARALKPHGGVVLYRTFVYNHHLDWRDKKNDRARAAYEIFHPLDGKFEDNVVLQIKHGPIDFQTREPVSSLIGALEHTNEAMEVEVTQEYTGQQRHIVYLIPMWKQVLDFDLHAQNATTPKPTPVKDLISGKIFHRHIGGMVAVTNVGLDINWLAHPFAIANLYGFARLAWDHDLTPEAIADEWTRLTFSNDPLVVSTITKMQLASWHIYESYTGPLGAGTMTDIIGVHYGPGIESSEHNGWGQWHRADHEGIGVDRTTATGTGYIGQYSKPVADMYELLATCPDELLLFMHHVPYSYRLRSGKTVIQHIYDSHYEGAVAAAGLVTEWKTLKGHVDDERYNEILQRLSYQAYHSIVWRDAISEWFLRTSGIADEKGRAGHHPDRIEAESMHLARYTPVDVVPWETASGGQAIACQQGYKPCIASFAAPRKKGKYRLAVVYFDQNSGVATFRVLVNDREVDAWKSDDTLPSAKRDGHTSTRHLTPVLALAPGDVLRINGVPDHGDEASLDYIEWQPVAESK